MKDTTEITRSVLDRRDAWRRERKQRLRRGMTRSMAVLALVMLLGGGVLAAGNAADWFLEFFGARSPAGLSGSQEVYIRSAAVYEPRTAVNGDWTLTIDYALSDGMDHYMLMTLTGPEDRELRQPSYFIDYVELYPPEEPEYRERLSYGSWVLAEETQRLPSNSVRLLMHLSQLPAEGYEGSPQTLELWDFVVSDENGEQVEWIRGCWKFEELTFLNSGESVELLAEPVLVQGWSDYRQEDCAVQIDSVQLRPFSLVVEYSRVDWMVIPDLDAQLVMRDGTVRQLYFGGGGTPDGGTMSADFHVPLVLSEVDYVLLNGIKLEMP